MMEILTADSFDRDLFMSMFRDPSECISFVDENFERQMSEEDFLME